MILNCTWLELGMVGAGYIELLVCTSGSANHHCNFAVETVS